MAFFEDALNFISGKDRRDDELERERIQLEQIKAATGSGSQNNNQVMTMIGLSVAGFITAKYLL